MPFKPTEAEIETVCRVIYERPAPAHIMAQWATIKKISPPLRALVREQAIRVLKWKYDEDKARKAGLL